MTEVEPRPLASVVFAVGSREVALGDVGGDRPCDLALVDDLLRLRHAASRLGWSIHLRDVAPGLRALLELAGLGSLLDPPDVEV